jgi:hypothetical protein
MFAAAGIAGINGESINGAQLAQMPVVIANGTGVMGRHGIIPASSGWDAGICPM